MRKLFFPVFVAFLLVMLSFGQSTAAGQGYCVWRTYSCPAGTSPVTAVVPLYVSSSGIGYTSEGDRTILDSDDYYITQTRRSGAFADTMKAADDDLDWWDDVAQTCGGYQGGSGCTMGQFYQSNWLSVCEAGEDNDCEQFELNNMMDSEGHIDGKRYNKMYFCCGEADSLYELAVAHASTAADVPARDGDRRFVLPNHSIGWSSKHRPEDHADWTWQSGYAIPFRRVTESADMTTKEHCFFPSVEGRPGLSLLSGITCPVGYTKSHLEVSSYANGAFFRTSDPDDRDENTPYILPAVGLNGKSKFVLGLCCKTAKPTCGADGLCSGKGKCGFDGVCQCADDSDKAYNTCSGHCGDKTVQEDFEQCDDPSSSSCIGCRAEIPNSWIDVTNVLYSSAKVTFSTSSFTAKYKDAKTPDVIYWSVVEKRTGAQVAGYPKADDGTITLTQLAASETYIVRALPVLSEWVKDAPPTDEQWKLSQAKEFATSCLCSGGTGAPTSFDVRQTGNTISYSWKDQTACEEQFVVTRSSTTIAEFTLDSDDVCSKDTFAPNYALDDVELLNLGQRYHYCVQAIKHSEKVFKSGLACQYHTVEWIGRIAGSVISETQAGVPGTTVRVVLHGAPASSALPRHTATTDRSGAFDISLQFDSLSSKQVELDVYFEKITDGTVHEYECGALSCTPVTVLANHLGITTTTVVDKTVAVAEGTVRVANTASYTENSQPCNVVDDDAYVCVFPVDSTTILDCSPLSSSGTYRVTYPGTLVVRLQPFWGPPDKVQAARADGDFDTNIYTTSHTFAVDPIPAAVSSAATVQTTKTRVLPGAEADVPSTTSELVAETLVDVPYIRLEPGTTEHFSGLDFTDTTTRTLTLSVVGGECGFPLGPADVEIRSASCPAYVRTLVVGSKTFSSTGIDLPAMLFEVVFEDMDQTQPSQQVLQGASSLEVGAYLRAAGLDRRLGDVRSSADTVTFTFHVLPTIKFTKILTDKTRCGFHVLPKEGGVREAALEATEYFGDKPCPAPRQYPSGGGTPGTVEYKPAKVRFIDKMSVRMWADGTTNECATDSGCVLDVGPAGHAEKGVVPVIPLSPRTIETVHGSYQFTLRFLFNVTGYPTLDVPVRVAVTGSAPRGNGFILRLPDSAVATAMLFDPPGGNSFATYSNAYETSTEFSHTVSGSGSVTASLEISGGLSSTESTCSGVGVMLCSTIIDTSSEFSAKSETSVTLSQSNTKTAVQMAMKLTEQTTTTEPGFVAVEDPVSGDVRHLADVLTVPAITIKYDIVQKIAYETPKPGEPDVCNSDSAPNFYKNDGLSLSEAYEWTMTPNTVTSIQTVYDIADVIVPELEALLDRLTKADKSKAESFVYEQTKAGLENWKQILDKHNLQYLGAKPASNQEPLKFQECGFNGGFSVDIEDADEDNIPLPCRDKNVDIVAPSDDATAERIVVTGGGQVYSVTTEEAVTDTEEYDVQIAFDTSIEAVAKIHLGITKTTATTESSLTLAFSYGVGKAGSTTNTITNVVAYEISDDDGGDVFEIEVLRSPTFGVPLFKTVAGISKCPWEPGTTKREGLRLDTVGPAIRENVPPTATLAYEVSILNTSPTLESMFVRFHPDLSTSNGLSLGLNGASFTQPSHLIVGWNAPPPAPAVNPVSVAVTAERGPLSYVYDNVRLVATSECEAVIFYDQNALTRAPIEDDVFISAHFLQPCAAVEWAGAIKRDRTFVVNVASLSSSVPNTVIGAAYNAEYATTKWKDHSRLGAVAVEWRRTGTMAWNSVFDSATSLPINLIDGESTYGFATFNWDVSTFLDGSYDLRLAARCKPSPAGGDLDLTTSMVITGIVDRKPPALLTLPEPADGVFFPGDIISITYDEDIDCQEPFSFVSSVVVGGATLRSEFLRSRCTGSTIQFGLDTAVPLETMAGKSVTISVTGVKDKGGNVDSTLRMWQFAVYNVSLDTASASIGSVRHTTPFLAIGDQTAFAANLLVELEAALELEVRGTLDTFSGAVSDVAVRPELAGRVVVSSVSPDPRDGESGTVLAFFISAGPSPLHANALAMHLRDIFARAGVSLVARAVETRSRASVFPLLSSITNATDIEIGTLTDPTDAATNAADSSRAMSVLALGSNTTALGSSSVSGVATAVGASTTVSAASAGSSADDDEHSVLLGLAIASNVFQILLLIAVAFLSVRFLGLQRGVRRVYDYQTSLAGRRHLGLKGTPVRDIRADASSLVDGTVEEGKERWAAHTSAPSAASLSSTGIEMIGVSSGATSTSALSSLSSASSSSASSSSASASSSTYSAV